MAKATNTRETHKWYNERRWSAAIVVAAFAGCYVVASLAIDSGSLLQYFVAIALLILGINRIAHIVIASFKHKAAA
jgi:hypothetical protein